jgi:hypothetical protein
MRQHPIMPSIGSREVAWAERSGIRHHEDVFQPLNFGPGLFYVHLTQSSRRKREWLKRLWRPPNASFRDQINRKAAQPVTALVMLARHGSQTRPPVCPGGGRDRRQPLVVLR